jgi:molybdopterin converting factor small subunit
MKVLVKFYVFDLPPGFGDAELEFSGSATVSDVFDACLELFSRRGSSMDENELRTATVMIGDKWSQPSDHISDGDTITIIRPMDGG